MHTAPSGDEIVPTPYTFVWLLACLSRSCLLFCLSLAPAGKGWAPHSLRCGTLVCDCGHAAAVPCIQESLRNLQHSTASGMSNAAAVERTCQPWAAPAQASRLPSSLPSELTQTHASCMEAKQRLCNNGLYWFKRCALMWVQTVVDCKRALTAHSHVLRVVLMMRFTLCCSLNASRASWFR